MLNDEITKIIRTKELELLKALTTPPNVDYVTEHHFDIHIEIEEPDSNA